MKKIILLALCALCTMTAWGQDIICYSYDASGNRTNRTLEPQTRSMATPMFQWDAVDIQPLATGILPYVSYQQPPNPSRILNTSLPVGREEGAACVSPIGAATYQIPVKVPGGTGGMQPQISAGYNSQGGNGLMGWGWNLSATSVIARVGKNCYYDGVTGEVKLDTSDNLMLDGKRLMRTSGNNLAIGSVYAAEVEDHSIVEYMTINARDAFQVRTADGLVYEYGTADDSYIHAQNSGVALFWLLSKVTDRFGNYMLYHYEKGMLPGEFYLSSIEYTGNTKANVSPYNRIEFAYRLRKDGIDAYTAGNVIRQRYLLTGIKCISNGAAVKEYRFKYIFDRYYSKLSEVEEYGLNGARYNSTIIDWGDYAGMYSKYAYERMALLSADREGLYPDFEDFNGDGLADMMTYPTQSSYSSSNNAVLYTGISLYGNDISYKKQCSIPLIQNFVRLMYADLNGDGKLDMIRVHQADAGNYRFEYYMFDGKAFKNAGGFNSSDFKAMAGDFNGDGKMELLTRDSKLYNEKAEVIASGGIDNWGEEYRYSYPNNNYIVDFNGDGQSDLLTMDYTGSWVYTLSGSGFIQLTSYRNTWLTCAQLNYFGDFNGDGKTDVLCRPRYDTHKLSLYLSTGRSFQTREIGNNGIESKILVGDTNLDGQDEIIHMNPAMGNIKLKVKVGTFNGSNFDHETYVSSMVNYSQINDDVANNRANVAVKDLDGDGRVELVLAAYADQNLIYAFDDKQNLKVKKIEDGYNNLVDFQYESLPSSAFYTEGSQSFAFPLAKMKVPLYVVTHKTTHVNGYSQSLTYAYKGLYVHRQGKGLLGFDSIEETYYDKQTKTIANYGYSRGGYIPYLSGLEVRSTNGTSMHETTCYSNVISKGNKRYEWQPSEIMEEDFLRGTLVSRYDNDYLYGRPQI